MINLDDNIKGFISDHEWDDVNKLALKGSLYPTIDIPYALTQIQGRQIAKNKIPSWYQNTNVIYPKHLSMEQCSSELTALYKSSLIKGNNMVDLTGGLGIDCFFLSKQFNHVQYVEKQIDLCEISSSNFQTLGVTNISVYHSDAIPFLNSMEFVDLIYIDPARRNQKGKKVVKIDDCEPNLAIIDKTLEERGKYTMIKLSPMLDISSSLAKISNIIQIHIVSINNECKELLLIKQKNRPDKNIEIICVNILKSKIEKFNFSKEEEEKEALVSYAQSLQLFLYEPNASILKAGGYKILAKHFNLHKLHPNTHLYTSDKLIDEFPGRIFQIENTCHFKKRDMKEYLKDIKQANISTRNFPHSTDELKKIIGIKDGGDTYIFGTIIGTENKKSLIICKKV